MVDRMFTSSYTHWVLTFVHFWFGFCHSIGGRILTLSAVHCLLVMHYYLLPKFSFCLCGFANIHTECLKLHSAHILISSATLLVLPAAAAAVAAYQLGNIVFDINYSINSKLTERDVNNGVIFARVHHTHSLIHSLVRSFIFAICISIAP